MEYVFVYRYGDVQKKSQMFPLTQIKWFDPLDC